MFEIVHKNNPGQRGSGRSAGSSGSGAKIKVIGVGGGGGNIVSTMIEQGVKFVEFLVANTDMQALQSHAATTKIQLGADLTKGLGAGANPEIGKEAAIESYNELRSHLEGTDMVFITAGMGGGTGTGAAPLVAKAAKEVDALTIGVVTLPFRFEGKRRREQAYDGIKELQQQVDTLIIIPNEKLISLANESLTLMESFKKVDEILLQAVRSVADLINVHGLINLDFSDIRTVMHSRGTAIMGVGEGCGAHRTLEAARSAMISPLLEKVDIHGAKGIILSIMGPADLSLKEVNDAATLIMDRTHEDAEIVFGAVIDPQMKDGQVKVTLIATGLLLEEKKHPKPSLSQEILENNNLETSRGTMGVRGAMGGRMNTTSTMGPSNAHHTTGSIGMDMGMSMGMERGNRAGLREAENSAPPSARVSLHHEASPENSRQNSTNPYLATAKNPQTKTSFATQHTHPSPPPSSANQNLYAPSSGTRGQASFPSTDLNFQDLLQEKSRFSKEGERKDSQRMKSLKTEEQTKAEAEAKKTEQAKYPESSHLTEEKSFSLSHRARRLSSSLFRGRTSPHGQQNGLDFTSKKDLEVPAFMRQTLNDKKEEDR